MSQIVPLLTGAIVEAAAVAVAAAVTLKMDLRVAVTREIVSPKALSRLKKKKLSQTKKRTKPVSRAKKRRR